MKIENLSIQLEPRDVEAIATAVVKRLNRTPDDIIFGVQALAKYLNVSTKWVYQRTSEKSIPHKKIDNTVLFKKKEIDKWLDSYNVPVLNKPKQLLSILHNK